MLLDNLPRKVTVYEVGPRDGLQNEPGNLPLAAKLEFIERIVGAGFKRIEVASFVNPKRVPQMADADELVRSLPRHAGVSYIGLVLNRRAAPGAGVRPPATTSSPCALIRNSP